MSLSLSFLLFVAGACFLNKQTRYTKFFLFLAGVSIAYFACSLDDFIHNWDEQFHALVAKNMMSDMFNPTLYTNPVLVPEIQSWSASYIWLHKQPLFMWQMAVSMKLFGVNEFALRLPNMLAFGFLLVMLFDIGRYFKNNITGFMLAFVFAYMRFPLVYAAGMEPTDHNDFMFMFYVTASFWAYFRLQETGKTKYLILTGVFVGCAILVKWLTGLLVLGVWGSYILIYNRKEIFKPAIAFSISILIALPWQVYCFIKYKSLFLQEMTFNNKHITEPLEGHNGPWYFHFAELENLYADDILIYFILAISLLLFCLNKKIDFRKKYFVVGSIVLVYGFFSFVKTKMPAFCIIAVPFIVLIIVISLHEILEKVRNLKIRYASLFIVTIFFASYLMNPSYFLKRHTLFFRPNEQHMAQEINNKAILQAIARNLASQKVALVNAGSLAIKAMFYTNMDASSSPLSKKKIDFIISQGYKVVAFKAGLPDFILQDHRVIKI